MRPEPSPRMCERRAGCQWSDCLGAWPVSDNPVSRDLGRTRTYTKSHIARRSHTARLCIAVRLRSGSQDAIKVHRWDEVSGDTTQEQMEPLADPFRDSGYRSELVRSGRTATKFQVPLLPYRRVFNERNPAWQYRTLRRTLFPFNLRWYIGRQFRCLDHSTRTTSAQ